MTDHAFELSIHRVIDVPRSAVWKAWMLPEHLVKWWCPRPWTTEIRAFDPRVGGAFDTLMRGPEGEESSNPGVFLEIVPEQRIVFTSALTAGWQPATPWLAMTAFILMEDRQSATHYTVRVLHKDVEDRIRHEEMGFEQGWGVCIDQLSEVAATLVQGTA